MVVGGAFRWVVMIIGSFYDVSANYLGPEKFTNLV